MQKRVKLSLYQAVEAHRVLMAARLSALRARRPLTEGRFLVLISVRG
jgi:hypothetical protein